MIDPKCNDETGLCDFECELPFKKNNNTCGCDSNEYCVKINSGWKSGVCDQDGKCFPTKCEAKYTLIGDECVNNDELCENNSVIKSECASFLKGDNIKTAGCVNDVCVVERCEAGFHISKDKKMCVKNTDSDCAQPDSSYSENCTNIERWRNGSCNKDGLCIAGSCTDSGLFENGQCVRHKTSGGGHDCANSSCNIDDGADFTNAATIYCRSNNYGYWGYEILQCKAGYVKKQKYVNERVCSNSCSICYKGNNKYYYYVCEKEE